MVDYTQVGNERLLPRAVAGDADAVAELANRGNTVTADGKLRKERVALVRVDWSRQRIPAYCTIENGDIVDARHATREEIAAAGTRSPLPIAGPDVVDLPPEDSQEPVA